MVSPAIRLSRVKACFCAYFSCSRTVHVISSKFGFLCFLVAPLLNPPSSFWLSALELHFARVLGQVCNGNSFLSRVSQAGCIFRISCSCFDQTPGPLQSSSPLKQCTIGPAGASEPWEAQCPTRVITICTYRDIQHDIPYTHANKDISLSHVSCLRGSLAEPDKQTLHNLQRDPKGQFLT